MKKLSKKLAIYVTAIVLAIGFTLPASVFADIDPATNTITVQYTHQVYIGKTCTFESGSYYIGDATFNYFVNWYYDGVYQYPSVVLEEGKTYTVEVTVNKANTAAQEYDLSEYDIDLKMQSQPFPYDEIIDKSKGIDEIKYTYRVTPEETPDMDQGAGTLDLSKGEVDIMKDPAAYVTIMALAWGGKITPVDIGGGEEHGAFDLDGDGKADMELVIDQINGKMTFGPYGNVSGKAPVTLKLTDAERSIIADRMSEMPYYSTLTVIFSASASLAKATVTGITAKTYTGKALKPAPKVVLKGKTLKAGKDYTVSYKNNVNVGKATVTIKGKGSYTGTKTKTFKINPKGTSLKSVAKASKAVKVKWTKQSAKMKKSRITGYQILLATNGKFTKGKKTVNVAGYSKISKKVTGLKGGKRYYVKVRTYKKIGNAKYYSKWSGVKSVKTAK